MTTSHLQEVIAPNRSANLPSQLDSEGQVTVLTENGLAIFTISAEHMSKLCRQFCAAKDAVIWREIRGGSIGGQEALD